MSTRIANPGGRPPKRQVPPHAREVSCDCECECKHTRSVGDSRRTENGDGPPGSDEERDVLRAKGRGRRAVRGDVDYSRDAREDLSGDKGAVCVERGLDVGNLDRGMRIEIGDRGRTAEIQ